MRPTSFRRFAAVSLLWAIACNSASNGGDGGVAPPDASTLLDGGRFDGSVALDATAIDSGVADSGAPIDGAELDAGRDPGRPSSTYPAFAIDWPQLQGSADGVIPSPRFVAITFDGDPLRTEIERVVAAIGRSSYWQMTTSEYGVGTATTARPIHLAGPAPTAIDDVDIQTTLLGYVDGTHPEWPTPDGRTTYLFFYPEGTRVTRAGMQGCMGFGGYHGAVTPAGVEAPYAVMVRCPPRANDPVLSTQLRGTTGVASHEMIEVVTDFDSFLHPGYAFPQDEHLAFVTFAGAEVGDMCEFNPSAFFVSSELQAAVQRTWSNASARAGLDPCVPTSTVTPYFVAVPSALLDDVPITIAGSSQVTKGVKLSMNEERTIELDLVSSGDTHGPFSVRAIDRRAFFSLGPTLTFRFDRPEGQNGEKIYMTVRRIGSDPDFGGAIPYAVITSQGAAENYWFSVVGAR
jgi:hypothetical protein